MRTYEVVMASKEIDVLGEKLADTDEPLFGTKITFVNVGDGGAPQPLNSSDQPTKRD